jgi:hypothetical protein
MIALATLILTVAPAARSQTHVFFSDFESGLPAG